MKINVVRRLTESAVMLAIATVLSMIPLLDMPFGGKLTPFSMLPIFIIAFRYGVGWGFVTSFTYGLIQMVLGLDNLSYATNWVAVVTIILLDYLVAYGVLGFGGLFRKSMKNRQWLGFSLGIAIGCILRFLCHFITGITVWADPSGELPVPLFSMLYNGAYMLPEMIITIILGIVLTSIFDLTSPSLKRVKK